MQFASWPSHFFTKLVCKFVDNSAQGTSNADTMAQKAVQKVQHW